MKILLFGKDGQVGWELQRSLAPLGELVALGSSGADGLAGDFRDPAAVASTVLALRPDIVVIAAAYTAVDRAEAEPELARLVNATAPGAIASAARACGALLVHYSSDYVFDGTGRRPWTESDATGPLNVYGATKLEGEGLVRAHAPRHLILRSSWIHSARGTNFIRTMLRLASAGGPLAVVDDQVGAPTSAGLLADITARLLPAAMADEGLCGLYHVAASGETSWHGYARFLLAQALQAGALLKVGPDDVEAVPSSRRPTPAARPLNSRLDTGKLRHTIAMDLPGWQDGVARSVRALVQGRKG